MAIGLKVCRLVQDFPTLGTSNTDGAYQITLAQASIGISVSVITRENGQIQPLESKGGISVKRVSRRFFGLNALASLLALDNKERFDVIHAHSTACLPYALLRRTMRRIPYVVHVHGTTGAVLLALRRSRAPENGQRESSAMATTLSNTRQRIVWKRADALIAVSNSTKSELRDLYDIPENRIFVVHNGVDPTLFAPPESKEAAKNRLNLGQNTLILNVSRYGGVKGLEFLVRAAAVVVKKHPGAKFVVIGGSTGGVDQDTNDMKTRTLVNKLGLSENVLLLGRMPYSRLVEFYAAADIFVLPSLYEGLPKVILEAMACGLPVVASNVGGIPELVEDEAVGLLTEPGEAECLAEALLRLISDKELRKTMGARARMKVEEEFTWNHAVRNITGVYARISPNGAN